MTAAARPWATELLHVWFHELRPADWWGGSDQVDAFWFAYMEVLDSSNLREQIKAFGYEQRLSKYYRHPLYLDLYARPGVNVESELLKDR